MSTRPLGPPCAARPPRLHNAEVTPDGVLDWQFRITNYGGDAGTATIDVYDDIGGYGGVRATEFIAMLRNISAPRIELHVNSGGGDVWDAVAMYNALLDHPARVTAVVDALAASAASFLIQAADQVVMGRNSELMIHDALGMTIGNAATHLEMYERLDAASENIASIYDARAGGGQKTWRSRMKDETWFSAEEAVSAGLADEVMPTPRRKGTTAPEDRVSWRYRNRAEAPAPLVDTACPVHHTATAEGTWDAGANTGRLPAPMTVAQARAVYGWYDAAQVDAGKLPKSAAKLPHHDVSGDGTPGAANMNGVRNALSRLPQSDIPEAEQDAVRRHLQAHMADARPADELDDPDQLDDAKRKKCAACGSYLSKDAVTEGRCQECNASLDNAADAMCPDCGAQVPAGAAECPECGADMGSGGDTKDSLADLLAMLDHSHPDTRGIHRALLGAALDANFGDTNRVAAKLEELEDFHYDPDALKGFLRDMAESPPPPDVPPPPEPEIRSVSIDSLTDALRRSLTS